MRTRSRNRIAWPSPLSVLLFELAFLFAYRIAVALHPNGTAGFSMLDAVLLCGLLLMVPSAIAFRQDKNTGTQLTESEQCFRTIVEEAPIMLWTAGTDARCTFFNKPWLDFTGLSLQEQTEQDWVARVHPNDRERSVNTYLSAFKSRQNFAMEYRLLRRDGVYGWVFHNGAARFDRDGNFIGYVGSRFDLTNRVEAEQYLREISSQIINGHKTESCLVGRELHDDLAQKVAAVSIGLGRFRHDENRIMTTGLDQVQQQLSDVCRHIVRLSDKLRPLTVEGRGLSAALRILCEDATVAKCRVLFLQIENVPRLPEDQSRTLYDIAEESIRNALTHSEATDIRVELSASAKTVSLCISDNGCGFVVEDITKRGLGLSAMSARVKNAGGDLRIISSPGEGTAVTATLTLAHSAKAISVG